jgi:hypothetical protein
LELAVQARKLAHLTDQDYPVIVSFGQQAQIAHLFGRNKTGLIDNDDLALHLVLKLGINQQLLQGVGFGRHLVLQHGFGAGLDEEPAYFV